MLDRISRLETIVGEADPARLHQLDEETRAGPGVAALSVKLENQCAESQNAAAQAANAETGEKYLSGEFWGNLCAEVEGIRQALDQPSDSDDDDDDIDDSPESAAVSSDQGTSTISGFLLGNPDYHERDALSHPPPATMMRLWAIYQRNVDPLMKILHRPTVTKQMNAYAESPTTSPFSPATNALMFVIYFCAVCCLSPESCLSQLGESRDALASKYRIGAERALAQADYLNSNQLETLQALTLYTVCLIMSAERIHLNHLQSMIRCYSHNRSSWALASLVVRLGQGQKLHRDGDGHRHTPYIAEMRRRLWYFIVVLDVRASEDRGSDSVLNRNHFDTILPTSIDDDDFGPETTGALIPKTSPAENVICLCTAMCSSIFGLLTHPQYNVAGEQENFIYSEDELIGHIRRLEDTFIHRARPSHLPSVYASEIARLVILKLWLNIQYPFTGGPAPDRPRVSRETMLRTSISIIELRERMVQLQWKDRFAWWTDTYVQWHPLAVALAELCVQTEGELVDRAWVVVDRTFPSSRDNIADTATGSLWRPIKKLQKKAKAARAEALMKKMTLNDCTASTTISTTTAPNPPADVTMENLQWDTNILPPTTFPSSTPGSTQLYDTSTMDPSILFEYPPDLLNLNFDPAIDQDYPMNWSCWTEFYTDAQKNASPESRGDDSM